MVFSGLGFGSSAPARGHAIHVNPAAIKRTDVKGRVRFRSIVVPAGNTEECCARAYTLVFDEARIERSSCAEGIGTPGRRVNLSPSAGEAVSDKPKYVEIKARTRAELERSLASGDVNIVCDALYSAAQNEQDWRWSQTQCLKMLNHESLLVRSSALIALGEIALFRGNLDLDVVLPEMKRFENDPALGPFVEDALDNIKVANTRSPKGG
jgi:hypothetical protein